MLFLFALFDALAAGPWTVGPGVTAVYIGADGDHYRNLAYSADGLQRQELGDGLSTLSFQAILSYGLTRRLQFDFVLPWHARHISRDDNALCQGLGGDACEPTHAVGNIVASMKGLVLDELSGAPFALSLLGILRSGAFNAATRDRLTAVGDGTTDLGGGLSIGRSGVIGQNGTFTASGSFHGFYRIPNSHNYPNSTGDRNVPGSEIDGTAELLLSPNGIVSIGPVVHGFHRLAGVNFDELEPTDPDRFVALRGSSLSAGGKLVVTDKSYNTFSLSVTRVAIARNAPSDSTNISVGIGLFNLFRGLQREK